MTRIPLTAEQISDLIAVLMVNEPACDCVSAPQIIKVGAAVNAVNWKTTAWRGQKDAIANCQIALQAEIEALQARYALPPG